MVSVCCEYDLHHPFLCFVLSDRFMIEIRSDDIDAVLWSVFFGSIPTHATTISALPGGDKVVNIKRDRFHSRHYKQHALRSFFSFGYPPFWPKTSNSTFARFE